MAFSAILAQVKAILEGVSGVENVHDYPRYAADITTLKNLGQTATNKFQLWFIERTAAPSIVNAQNQVFRQHQFTLWGFYALEDSTASEKTFQALLDSVMDAFDANITLNSTVDNQPQAAQLLEKADVEFAGILCHRARILITAEEEVTQ